MVDHEYLNLKRPRPKPPIHRPERQARTLQSAIAQLSKLLPQRPGGCQRAVNKGGVVCRRPGENVAGQHEGVARLGMWFHTNDRPAKGPCPQCPRVIDRANDYHRRPDADIGRHNEGPTGKPPRPVCSKGIVAHCPELIVALSKTGNVTIPGRAHELVATSKGRCFAAAFGIGYLPKGILATQRARQIRQVNTTWIMMARLTALETHT